MKNKILMRSAMILVLVLVLFFVYHKLFQAPIEDEKGLYAMGTCLKNIEFGVTYKVQNTVKGQTFAVTVSSEKYPSQEGFRVGTITHWSASELRSDLVSVDCPE
ncbi:hypothetical protein D3C87_102800 [compost metagenome]